MGLIGWACECPFLVTVSSEVSCTVLVPLTTVELGMATLGSTAIIEYCCSVVTVVEADAVMSIDGSASPAAIACNSETLCIVAEHVGYR